MPLPDSVLQHYLGGVTEELFQQMFGFDHTRLIEGGRQLVMGGGRVGESLFSAGAGISNLHQVLRDLRDEADKLFKPAGQIPLINHLIREYKDAKDKGAARTLSGREWETHDRALRDAKAGQIAGKIEIDRLRREQQRLLRMREALPIIKEREDALKGQDAMKEVILLPPSFPEERRAAKKALDEGIDCEIETGRELEGIEAEIQGLLIPDVLLKQEEVITEIHQRCGSHRKAQADLPKLEGEWDRLQSDAKALLLEVRPDLDIENAGGLRITVQKRTRIEDLGKKLDKMEEKLENTIRAMTEIETALSSARDSLNEQETPKEPGNLQAAVSRAQRKADLEDEIKALQTGLQKKETQAGVDLKALPLWSGSLADLEVLPVPLAETIDLFDDRFQDLDNRIKCIADRIKEEGAKADGLDKDIKALKIEASVPTEKELIDARIKREKGWDLILRAWIKKEDTGKDALEYSSGLPLHEAYEEAVRKADEVADRLRREADRVATLANLTASKEQCERALEGFKGDYDEALKCHSLIEKEWYDLWEGIGIKAQSPGEMKAWLKKQEALAAKTREIREDMGRFTQIDQTIKEHKLELCEGLEALGIKGPPSQQDTLNTLIDYAFKRIEEINDQAEKRKDLEKEITRCEKDLRAAKRDKQDIEVKLTELRKTWIEEVRELGMGDNTTPSQANAFIMKIQDLFTKIDDAEKLQKRILGIQRDAEHFQKDVKALVEQMAPDLLPMPPHQAAVELNSRLKKAREDAAKLNELKKREKEKRGLLQKAQDTIREMEQKISEMCKRAGCTLYEDLEEKEGLSDRKRTLAQSIEQHEKEIKRIAHNGGMTVEELMMDAKKCDPDALPQQIENINRQIHEKEEELSKIDQIIGREAKELEKMDGGSDAAEAAEEMKGILAQIQENAERYMHLCTASLILSREIERYRRKHQGPILERASRLFSDLTRGSFSGLKTAYDDKDNPILLGVRPSGKEIEVSGMSDGTSDQLYLSLRLASLERHMEQAEPMPFIIDDILINFDNERARATMKVLSDISHKTQIIFFTHHLHILDLAREAVSEEKDLYVHYL